MPWIRISIGVGGVAMVAGVTGMLLWIEDGSHYFDLAVAVAMAGFLTLVAVVLTRVFGSSHGSQDDAFRRGRSMGYDEGFLEGHRTARPVVVPLHAAGRDLDVPVSDPADQQATANVPTWRRDTLEQESGWDRVVVWVRARRVPLLAGALSLILIGAVVATAVARTPVQTEAFPQPQGELFHRAVPHTGVTPALVEQTGVGPTRLAPVSGAAPVPVAGAAAVGPAVAGDPAARPAGTQTSPLGQLPGAAAVGHDAVGAATDGVAAVGGVSAPAAGPAPSPVVQAVAAAPVVPLTAAEQTAANAKAAADLTAANAAAAAAETARVAAAAAEATRLQAAADAYAVAHPGG